MKHIDMSRNDFTDRSGIAFGTLLAANDYLETLNLSWNIIRGAGATAIAKGLKVRRSEGEQEERAGRESGKGDQGRRVGREIREV